MKKIAEAIGFSALVAAAVTLELNGHTTGGLWLLIVIWAVCL